MFHIGLQTDFSFRKTIRNPCCFDFSPLQQLFCESPFRSPWYWSNEKTNGLSSKWRASRLPIQIYWLMMGFQRASLCGRPFEAPVPFDFQIYCNSFVKARLEARVIKALKKTNGLASKWRATGLPIQIFCLIMGFQWASLCGRPFEAPVPFDFQIYCNSFVKARLEARVIKALKKTNGLASKRRATGLPIQIFCLIMGLQWASLCGRPFEARVAFDFQIYCNSFVKARPEARGI